MKKKDKKSLDREIRSALLEDVEWMTTVVAAQWKKILAVGIIIIIAVAVVYSLSLESKRKAHRAANVLGAAQTVEALNKALAEYPSYEASNFARLRLARLYIAQKDFDAARKQYAEIAANGASDDILNRMRLDEAYLLELSGDRKGAAAAFQQAALGLNDLWLKSEAFYSAGRLYAEVGDLTAAREALRQAEELGRSGGAAGLFAGLSQSLLLSLDSHK